MPFPEVERVIYQKNPLKQVIAQLRFPPILRIEADVPADFQDRVRSDFPRFNQKIESPTVEVPPELAERFPQELLLSMASAMKRTNYEFVSRDGSWKLNLTRNFLALTCSEYTRWEDFEAKIQGPLEAFVHIYSPDSYSRIGLRYIDVIQRSVLGLDDSIWPELLHGEMTGALNSPHLSTEIEAFRSRHQIRLADGESKVQIVAGLFDCPDGEEECFKIDSDFYNDNETAVESATEKLDFLRLRGSRLFRWAITDQLHEAMEPVPIC